MMKLKYFKQIFLGILCVLLVLPAANSTTNFVVPSRNVDNFDSFVTEQLVSTVDNSSVVDEITSKQQALVETSDYPTDWETSESIMVTFKEQKSTILPETISLQKQWVLHNIIEYYTYMNTFVDDANYWSLRVVNSTYQNPSETGISLSFSIDAHRAGSLYYNCRNKLNGSSPWDSSSYTINASNIDYSGKLNFVLEAGFDGGSDWLRIYLYTPNGIVTILNREGAGSFSNPEFYLELDYFYFQVNSLTSHVRSERQYTSATNYINRLYINNYRASSTLYVYLPDYLTYSNIEPEATTSRNSTCLTITNTVTTTYKLDLLGGVQKGYDYLRQNQFLAISDTTSTYFEHIGFEDAQYADDWSISPTFDTISLNTTIVSSGSFSLRLEDSDASTDYFYTYDGFPLGEYYVAFDYYVESISAGDTVYLNWYDSSGSSNIEYLDYTNNQRWHTAFIFMDLQYTTYDWFRIGAYTFEGVLFIDNFRIYETNAECITTAYQETQLSGKVISWDNRDNPSLKTNITTEIRVRANDTSVYSKNLETNVDGSFTLTLTSADFIPAQLGYVIKIICWDSFFSGISGYDNIDLSDDFSNWDPHSGETITDETDYLKFTDYVVGSGTAGIRYDKAGTFDYSNIDYFCYETWFNQSEDTTAPRAYIRDGATGGTKGYLYYEYDSTLSNTWLSYQRTIDSANSKESGFDITDIDRILFYHSVSDYKIEVRLRNVKLLMSQKSYFTPSTVTKSIDYAETELGDSYDFSEGDNDDWTTPHTAIMSQTVENGLTRFTAYQTTGTSYSFTARTTATLSINASMYNYLYLRVRATNATWNLYGFSDASGYIFWANNNYNFASEWVTFEFDLSNYGDWSGTETQMQFVFNPAPYPTYIDYTLGCVEIDYVRLVRVDTPTLHESDSHYYLSSTNNTFQSYLYNDSDSTVFDESWSDLEFFSKETSVGTYTIAYIVWNDLDEPKCYVPADAITDSYTISADAFVVSVKNEYEANDEHYIFCTANYDFSYEIYENGSSVSSGSGLATGSTISHTKDTTAGVLILLAYKFTYNAETDWYNSSYSNAASDAWDLDIKAGLAVSDLYCYLPVTSNYDCSYYVYKNNVYQSITGTVTANIINNIRIRVDNTPNSTIEYQFLFNYSSQSEWYNTSISNPEFKLVCWVADFDYQSDQISIDVAASDSRAQFILNDNATAGVDANGYAGSYTWTKTSNYYGHYRINVTAYFDYNNDSTYQAWEVASTYKDYYVFEQQLVLESVYTYQDTDDFLYVYFKTNYYNANRTQFRYKRYDDVSESFSDWAYEKTTNGSFSFSLADMSYDVEYDCIVELQVSGVFSSTQTTSNITLQVHYKKVKLSSSYYSGGSSTENNYYTEQIIQESADAIEEVGEIVSFWGSALALLLIAVFALLLFTNYRQKVLFSAQKFQKRYISRA